MNLNCSAYNTKKIVLIILCNGIVETNLWYYGTLMTTHCPFQPSLCSRTRWAVEHHHTPLIRRSLFHIVCVYVWHFSPIQMIGYESNCLCDNWTIFFSLLCTYTDYIKKTPCIYSILHNTLCIIIYCSEYTFNIIIQYNNYTGLKKNKAIWYLVYKL